MNKYLFLLLSVLVIGVTDSKDLETLKAETIDSILENYMDRDPKELFKVYHLVFRKKYTLSSEEAKLRFKNFKNNLEIIRRHNEGNHSYKQGINQFSDLSLEEFRKKYLRKRKRESEDLSDAKFISDEDEQDDLTKRNLETSKAVDWSRYFGPIRDQGDCSSCWTFSDSGIVEGCLGIKQGSPVQQLSPQQLLDCDREQQGCDGGDIISNLQFIKKNGLMADSDYPYTASKGSCKFSSSKVVGRITGTSYCSNYKKQGSCTASIVKSMVQKGPLAVGIDGGNDGFMNYKSGIFDGDCSDDNHAVILVGFGSDSSGEYWIVRNSWGSSWGMNGYVKVKRNDSNNNSCYVSNEAVACTC